MDALWRWTQSLPRYPSCLFLFPAPFPASILTEKSSWKTLPIKWKLQRKARAEVLIWDFYPWVHPPYASQGSTSEQTLLAEHPHVTPPPHPPPLPVPLYTLLWRQKPAQLSRSPPRKKHHLSNTRTPPGRNTSTWKWHKPALGTESFPGEITAVGNDDCDTVEREKLTDRGANQPCH